MHVYIYIYVYIHIEGVLWGIHSATPHKHPRCPLPVKPSGTSKPSNGASRIWAFRVLGFEFRGPGVEFRELCFGLADLNLRCYAKGLGSWASIPCDGALNPTRSKASM